jgi:hypothetical protein
VVEQDFRQVVFGKQTAGYRARCLEGWRDRPSMAISRIVQVKIGVDGLELSLLKLRLEAVSRQGRRYGVWRCREIKRSCHSRRITPARYNS